MPKLHSSQIRTSVSGRTYESQTGLCVIINTMVSIIEMPPNVPFSVAFLTETANGLRCFFGQFWFVSCVGWDEGSPMPGWRLHMIKSMVHVRLWTIHTSGNGYVPGWCLDMVGGGSDSRKESRVKRL